MRGMVAADSCFRAFLYLHGDLGWGREALFNMRISPGPTFVTVSCPGQLIMVNFIRIVSRPDHIHARHCFRWVLL